MNRIDVNLGAADLYRVGERTGCARLLTMGPLLVFAFLAEALVATGSFSGFRICHTHHMVATALFLILVIVAGEAIPLRCRQRAWNSVDRRTRPLFTCVMLLVSWGLVSCLFQRRFFLGNLVFWAMWSMTYLAAFHSIPRLLSGLGVTDRIRFVAIVLGFGALASILMPGEPVQGRFVGVFGNPTWTGIFLASATVYFFGLMLLDPRNWSRWGAFCVVSFICLVMTRTRAAIAATFVGIGVEALLLTTDRSKGLRDRAVGTILLIPCMGLALTELAYSDALPVDSQAMAEYLRISGGPSDVYESRKMNWEAGVAGLLEVSVEGKGFLSKFGNAGATTRILGIEFPSYDWTSSADPLNSFMLVSMQIGLPGGILFLALLWSLWAASNGLPVRLQVLFRGFLVIGLTQGFLSGNWLLSFGDSFDRFSFVVLGLMLYCPDRDVPITSSGTRLIMNRELRE